MRTIQPLIDAQSPKPRPTKPGRWIQWDREYNTARLFRYDEEDLRRSNMNPPLAHIEYYWCPGQDQAASKKF